MSPVQLMTMLALDQRRRANRQVRAAFALSRLGYLSLGDAHARNSLINETRDAEV